MGLEIIGVEVGLQEERQYPGWLEVQLPRNF